MRCEHRRQKPRSGPSRCRWRSWRTNWKRERSISRSAIPALASKTFRQRRVSTHGFAGLMRAGHPRWAERISREDFLAVQHMVVREDGRSQEVLERFFGRRRIRRKVAVFASHFLSVPFVVARSDLIATVPYRVATEFAEMSPQLAIALPPFDIPGFDLKLHWHRRFDNEPRNRWLREQLATMFRDDPSSRFRGSSSDWPSRGPPEAGPRPNANASSSSRSRQSSFRLSRGSSPHRGSSDILTSVDGRLAPGNARFRQPE